MTEKATAGASKPRKERKDNADMRRRQLLEAAQRSVMQHGLAKTTLATVAAEAGLSQGVAVFYFKSKNGLLTETLRAHYQTYADTWRAAMESAGPDPLDRLMALIAADFSPEVCTPEALSIWFAFWGEQNFTPQYAEISRAFDKDRGDMIRSICRDLLAGAPDDDVNRFAEWIDTLTDGFWQTLHLQPHRITREHCLASTRAMILQLLRG
ncbi:TetR family transcriptional regulator C-terminal domain-containing protein [Pseudosulfitobacter koreensis]|uniref:TetR family transcriptional regulator C-terminal domain-containing protein n=1 Tax=Pseudosulfitobacter koreensis TaxID=2968472 RepID=A0ABT1Z306_9RHOB|nr:TetR family transcriptional regulator C-terminal domain-containing protein [Pseudosulfitobacter koreense]MCR8827488.1 TetR family transcriptional regulator C-terminal domain-containing protein [Pseudosulfitobacter koreense]